MNVKLLTKQHLGFLSLKDGCTGLSESTLVKIPPCWKSGVMAHISDKHMVALNFSSKYFQIPSYQSPNLIPRRPQNKKKIVIKVIQDLNLMFR